MIERGTNQMLNQSCPPVGSVKCCTTEPEISAPSHLPTPYVAKAINPWAEFFRLAGAFFSTNNCPVRKKKLTGKAVPGDFEYHSGNNSEWLSVEQMRDLITEIDVENSATTPTLSLSEKPNLRIADVA